MTVRIIRVSWQRFDSSHSQLGSFSNSREPLHLTSLQAPAFFARGGLLLMVFMWLPQRTRLLPRLLCHYCLPPRAQIGSRIPASVLPPYHFGHIWSATSPSSLSPEKLQSLDFNSLRIPRTTQPPSKLSDASSCSTCFTWTVGRSDFRTQHSQPLQLHRFLCFFFF